MVFGANTLFMPVSPEPINPKKHRYERLPVACISPNIFPLLNTGKNRIDL
jgi:hypothetical protein